MLQTINQKNTSIDLNCDLGEYELLSHGSSDAQIMPYISSCNIACGAHAGNQLVIEQVIECAIKNQVNIGAHPSFPDRTNFGRQVMDISQNDLKVSLKQQILLIKQAAEVNNGRLVHVKPHGALYNQAAVDLSTAILIVETVNEIDSDLKIFGLAHSKVEVAAQKRNLSFVAEGFADRAYAADKTLVPRNQFGACIEDPQAQLQQVLFMLKSGQVKTVNEAVVDLKVATICLHGDQPDAIKTAQILNQGIQHAGFRIEPPI